MQNLVVLYSEGRDWVMRGGVARITDDREGRNGRDEQMI